MPKTSKLAGIRRSLEEHARMVEREQALQQRAYLESIQALMEALEARDSNTRGHAERVHAWAIRIGRQLGLPASQIEELGQAARLHDIGKLGIRDAILEKVGPLLAEEWQVMRSHPLVGVTILKPLEFLRYTLPIIGSHHERWDGRGYPDGLRADAIPLAARIVAVADSYDALVSNRVYRPGFDREKARGILLAGAGSQWDERVVNAFLAVQNPSIRSTVKPLDPVNPMRDVVCGMLVIPDHSQARVEYTEHVYFFCSTACREAFDQSPESYL